MNEISCDNCGASCAGTTLNTFYCSKAGHLFQRHWAYTLAAICKLYPVPKPAKLSKPGLFEQAWDNDNDRLCLTGDAKPKTIYCAGYLAAIGQMRYWIKASSGPLGVIYASEFLDQMQASAKEPAND